MIDLLALEHVVRAGDVGRDINVIVVFEQPTQTIASGFSSSTMRMVG